MRWRALGFDGVSEVRAGKVIELELAETDPAARAPRPRRWRASCWPIR